MCFPMKKKKEPSQALSGGLAYLTLHSLKIVADLSDIIDILPVLVPERMVVRPRVLLDLPLQD